MTLYATGFEEAILGWGERFHDTFVVYDLDKLLNILVERDGMTMEEAREYYEFNIVGAWVGDKTPAFIVQADAETLYEFMEGDEDGSSD